MAKESEVENDQQGQYRIKRTEEVVGRAQARRSLGLFESATLALAGVARSLVFLEQGVHGSEPSRRVEGEEKREEVVEGQLWCRVKRSQDLVRPVRVHVVVAVPLDAEEQVGGC